MDDYCDTAVIALTLILAACLTIFVLKVGTPSGALVDLLLRHV